MKVRNRNATLAVVLGAAASLLPLSPAANGSPDSTTVIASRAANGTGGELMSYGLPDGAVMQVPVPPTDFKPLNASDADLRRYDFPARPADPSALREWTAVMAAYKSDPAPASVLTAPVTSFNTQTVGTSWSGYTAGTLNTQSHNFVAVKATFAVPTNANVCSTANPMGAWIGLGGTNGTANDLVQQGIACGASTVGGGSGYRPFTQFANTQNPLPFCGQTTWVLPAGHSIYQNMSYQSGSNTAYFYLQDVTSGVAHSCSISKPAANWAFNGNTADWIVEGPRATTTGSIVNFGSVRFTGASAELGSNGSWVTLGTQNQGRWIMGTGTAPCAKPWSISNGDTFLDQWYAATC